MWVEILSVVFVGGLVSLDRSAAFQFMISRPIVCGPIIGLLLGQLGAGVLVGALFELIWIGNLPLGGHLPPNECLGTIVATATIIIACPPGATPTRALIVLGFLTGPPAARLGIWGERLIRRSNATIEAKLHAYLAEGRVNNITRLTLYGLGVNFLTIALLILILLPPSVVLVYKIHSVMSPLHLQYLNRAFLFLPLIGIASALSTMSVKRSHLAFTLLFFGTLVALSI